MPKPDTPTFTPKSQSHWREWLQANHDIEESVWLIVYKKASGVASITWSESVDESLCFGWIDSTKKTLDKNRYMQYYSRRKPTSTWSKVNKDKVEKLMSDELMTQAGLDTIRVAKENGSWTILDSVEALIIPDDLDLHFETQPGSKDHYLSLSKSVKKMLLTWVVFAKREETRKKRIAEIVERTGEGTLPKQFL